MNIDDTNKKHKEIGNNDNEMDIENENPSALLQQDIDNENPSALSQQDVESEFLTAPASKHN